MEPVRFLEVCRKRLTPVVSHYRRSAMMADPRPFAYPSACRVQRSVRAGLRHHESYVAQQGAAGSNYLNFAA